MANRAYLYFTDDVSALTFENHYQKRDGSDRNYMDSRHQFPLAWFLFFGADDVRLVPTIKYNWSDLYLAREWNEARAAFLSRVPLLLSWLQGEFSHSDVDVFLSWVALLRDTPEELYLVVDPGELEIEEDSAPAIRAALAALEDSSLSDADKWKQLDVWSGTIEPFRKDAQRNNVFGIYYGPIIDGVFRRSVLWPDEAA